MTGGVVWSEWHDDHITDRHKVTRAEVIEVLNDDLTRVTQVHEEDDYAAIVMCCGAAAAEAAG